MVLACNANAVRQIGVQYEQVRACVCAMEATSTFLMMRTRSPANDDPCLDRHTKNLGECGVIWHQTPSLTRRWME